MSGITRKEYGGHSDYLAMREMLLEGYALSEKPSNMFFYYLDNWRFANDEPDRFFEERAVLWLDDEKVVAYSILDNLPLYNLQIHPHYSALASDVLEYLVQCRAVTETAIFEHQDDIKTHLGPARFGNARNFSIEYEYDLASVVPTALPAGYRIVTLSDSKDFVRAYALAKGTVWSGDHMSHEAIARRLMLKQKAASYSNDTVFLVLKESDHSCAAFAAAWLDPVTSCVGFEPVGTVTTERRRGLGKALLTHVFKMCGEKGFKTASIQTGTPDLDAPANHLYHSLEPAQSYNVVAYTLG